MEVIRVWIRMQEFFRRIPQHCEIRYFSQFRLHLLEKKLIGSLWKSPLDMYLWTRKSPLNFRSYPDSWSGSGSSWWICALQVLSLNNTIIQKPDFRHRTETMVLRRLGLPCLSSTMRRWDPDEVDIASLSSGVVLASKTNPPRDSSMRRSRSLRMESSSFSTTPDIIGRALGALAAAVAKADWIGKRTARSYETLCRTP